MPNRRRSSSCRRRMSTNMCWSKGRDDPRAGAVSRACRRDRRLSGARAGFVDLDEAMRNDSRRRARPSCRPTDRDTVCALFHTGGTTGRPKLVRLTHGNQIHAAFGFAQVFGYDERDIVINGFPFFHVGGTMTVGLSVIAAGGHVVVPSPYGLRTPAVVENYWRSGRELRRHGGGRRADLDCRDHQQLEDRAPMSPPCGWPSPAARCCPRRSAARFEATTGIRIFETYGMTETAAAIAFNPGRGEPLAGSVGFRAPYSETRIVSLDPNSLERLPAERDRARAGARPAGVSRLCRSGTQSRARSTLTAG